MFEQEDADRGASADLAVVEHRRRLLQEWMAWRESLEFELEEDRRELGLPSAADGAADDKDEGEGQVIEEIVEEIVEESEEIIG